ncbi:MAG: hypothetical protein IKX86_01030 [Clostridia bacterium]|nr:hypothetical protein [Clostridia bacterium]MBR5767245.1 hypothetical protein [Clostridia bacterium]
MSLLNKIRNALLANAVAEWRISETVSESSEYFFVKKQLDTRRSKTVEKCEVAVFRAEGDKKGFTTVTLTPGMSSAEIGEKIKDAYYAAQFALNPGYDLPDPVKSKKKPGESAGLLGASEKKMIAALFKADKGGDAFLNSAEMFFERNGHRIVTSNGTDVRWTNGRVCGEFVVQCVEPEDVELHNIFEYDSPDAEALTAKVAEALRNVRDRARAQKILKSGVYDVVLCGNQVPEVLSYYEDRADAAMIYPHYSEWKAGDEVQNTGKGEKISLTLLATSPFSDEGIPMKDRPLLRRGVLKTVHGSNRLCRYLGVEPTGGYRKLGCDNKGRLSFEDMKKKPCLVTVVYSDFQMDSFTGNFGGEIRLAYLVDGDSVTPVTGGSVNGRLPACENGVVFSTDRYRTASYDGPYAMRISGVNVAGAEN